MLLGETTVDFCQKNEMLLSSSNQLPIEHQYCCYAY